SAELAREARSGSLVLVLEEGVGLAPRLTADSLRPGAEVRRGVVGAAQAQVPPRGRRLVRRGELVVLRPAESGARRRQRPEHLVVEPRLVSKLERRATGRREQGQEIGQASNVLLQVRRKLEEHRAEPISQGRRNL